MFVELSNITFDLCKKNGIRVIFGFPNQNSYHGAVHKLGWKLTHTMECFIIPVKTLPLARLSGKINPGKKIYRWYAKTILNRHKRPEKLVRNSVISDGYCGICRDADYEHAKDYIERQVSNLGEARAWCKFTDECIVGDMDVNSNNFERAIRKLKNIAAQLGTRQLQFHASPGTSLHHLLSKKYSSIPSFPALFQQFDEGTNIENIKFTLADIDIF
jgi:hypothetical protein